MRDVSPRSFSKSSTRRWSLSACLSSFAVESFLWRRSPPKILDMSKARNLLGYRDVVDVEEATRSQGRLDPLRRSAVRQLARRRERRDRDRVGVDAASGPVGEWKPMSRTRLAWRIPLLLLAALGCQKSPEPPPSLPVVQGGPRLLLLVAVDQLAFEYLGRFDPFFEGGLRQLMDQGVLFENASYDHAITVTASGHAAMASGLHPASSGIIGNAWYDRGLRSTLYSFEGREHLRSPRNLNGTVLADWLKELDPRSKAFTASAKDRSAIAMGGHAADAAYWFDKETGAFITGSYYTDRPPEWVEDFNRSRHTDRIFGDPWDPLPLTDEELDQLGIVEIDEGLFPRRFPHSIGNQSVAPGGSFYQGIYASPFVDTHLLEFAEALVDAEQLGQREHLDYLALGLSALDSVGHSFGPHSREAADVVLRLDRNLGRFLEFLDARIGLERVVIALTADHGVLPVPEYTSSLGLPGARMGAEDRVCFQGAGRAIAQRFSLEDWVMSGFYLDREMIESAGR